MIRRPVKSSSIRSVGYDPLRHQLEIEFATGGIYRYHNVEPGLHAKFMNSPSLGAAYNSLFWGRPKEHPATTVAPVPPKPITTARGSRAQSQRRPP